MSTSNKYFGTEDWSASTVDIVCRPHGFHQCLFAIFGSHGRCTWTGWLLLRGRVAVKVAARVTSVSSANVVVVRQPVFSVPNVAISWHLHSAEVRFARCRHGIATVLMWMEPWPVCGNAVLNQRKPSRCRWHFHPSERSFNGVGESQRDVLPSHVGRTRKTVRR